MRWRVRTVVEDADHQYQNIEHIIEAAGHVPAAQLMMQELAAMPLTATDSLLVYVFFEPPPVETGKQIMFTNLRRPEGVSGREGWTASLDDGSTRPLTDEEWSAIVKTHGEDFIGMCFPAREEEEKKEKRKRG